MTGAAAACPEAAYARHPRRAPRRSAVRPRRQPRTASRDLRPLGQIHDSFIVAAGADGLWIIDQHVAHERILFEQVLRQQAAGRVETPATADADRIGADRRRSRWSMRASRTSLHALGFETEPFGNRTIAVKAAPAGVGAGRLEKLIFEILEIAESELRQSSRWTICGGTSPRPSPAGPPSRSTCAWTQAENGMAAHRAGRDRVPDELPARPPDRPPLLHAGHPEGIPQNLR